MTDTSQDTPPEGGAEILYSGSAGGFYTQGISQNIPADAVIVAAGTFKALLKAQAKGATLSAGADGLPVALAPDGSTIDLAAVETVASYLTVPVQTLAQKAQDLFDAGSSKMWADYGCLGETPPEVWTTYLKALRAIATGADTVSVSLPVPPDSVAA